MKKLNKKTIQKKMEEKLILIESYVNEGITKKIKDTIFYGDTLDYLIKKTYVIDDNHVKTNYGKRIKDLNYQRLKNITDFLNVNEYIIPENLFVHNKYDIIIENSQNKFAEFMIDGEFDIEKIQIFDFYKNITNVNIYILVDNIDRSHLFMNLLKLLKCVLYLTVTFQYPIYGSSIQYFNNRIKHKKYMSIIKHTYYHRVIFDNINFDHGDATRYEKDRIKEYIEFSNVGGLILNVAHIGFKIDVKIRDVNKVKVLYNTDKMYTTNKSKSESSTLNGKYIVFSNEFIDTLHVESESFGMVFCGMQNSGYVNTTIIENMCISEYSGGIKTKDLIIKNSFIIDGNNLGIVLNPINPLKSFQFEKLYLIFDNDNIDNISIKMEKINIHTLLKHSDNTSISTRINDSLNKIKPRNIFEDKIISNLVLYYYNSFFRYNDLTRYTKEEFKKLLVKYYIDRMIIDYKHITYVFSDKLASILNSEDTNIPKVTVVKLYSIETNQYIRDLDWKLSSEELYDNITLIEEQIKEINHKINKQ